jgi:hypothetical protein
LIQRPRAPRAFGAAQAFLASNRLLSDMEQRETMVAVRPGSALSSHARLFAALEAAFPVTFVPWRATAREADAVVAIGAPGPELEGGRAPLLTVGDAVAPGAVAEEVRFTGDPQVDARLRGIALAGQALAADVEHAGDAERVLASAGSRAVWTRSPGGRARHQVRAPLLELAPHAVLRDGLSGQGGLALIVLVQFLRELSQTTSFRPPPLRASIIFDDPNLRWRSYGFIDYEGLVRHADAHGYHAAMAMIPLDWWRPHRATAALFRRRSDRVSLVFHGNNHVKRELLRLGDDSRAMALSAQALRRISRFEARYDLRVDRIMTPPHGMCSASVARALGAVGFDALCSIHPLPWTESPPADRLLAGWDPAEFAGPCAVIPRFPLSCSATDIALRAFLDQPLVLYGHHDDLAQGLELLAEAAARVNRLGDVQWTSLGSIALGNHAIRVEGDTAWVRPYSGRIRVQLPERVRALALEEPRDVDGSVLGWSVPSGPDVPFGVPVPCAGGRVVEARLLVADPVDPGDVGAPSWRPWPPLRRVATEARDRALPLRQRSPWALSRASGT